MDKEEGLVIKSTGSNYIVRTRDDIITCKLRGKFRIQGIKATNPIAVGDNVLFTRENQQDGFITDILPRKNYIYRKSVNLSKISHIIAANIDAAFLIVGMTNPRTPLGFIDRFLVAAESFRIKTTLVFNKTDLYDSDLQQTQKQLQEVYTRIGYQCLSTSVISQEGLAVLKSEMKDKVSLFSGQSGVGKSSIINSIEPDLQLKVSGISDYNSKGKHTTTFAEMFELSFGGFIIDTPGIKEFGLIHYEKEEISHYFPEMLALLPQCRFSNCTHTHEPGCAVKQAWKEERIADSRYQNYLAIIHGEDIELKEWMLE